MAREGITGFRAFLVIWFGQLISLTGSGLTGFALGVWVYLTTGSTTLFALIQLVSTLPTIVIGPFAGALVDRVFNPLLTEGGAWAGTLGRVIGVGAGRGIGALFIVLGLAAFVVTAIALAYRPLRRVEDELPDAVIATAGPVPVA